MVKAGFTHRLWALDKQIQGARVHDMLRASFWESEPDRDGLSGDQDFWDDTITPSLQEGLRFQSLFPEESVPY